MKNHWLWIILLTETLTEGNENRHIQPVEKPTQQQKGYSRLLQATDYIRAKEARTRFNVTGKGLTVAILDTGLRTTHVDFAGRIVGTKNFTTDNNNKPDDANDGNGHGTNVTGIIAAKGDHIGIAPETGIVSLKIIRNDGSGSFTQITVALQWIIDNYDALKIRAVNMSLGDGGNYVNLALEDATREKIRKLRDLRIPVIAAAGNGFYNHKSQQGMIYPAIFPETISVGALYDADIGRQHYIEGAEAFTTGPGRIVPFSQRLHSSLNENARTDIFAPGTPIISSGIFDDHGESIQCGTSQSTAVVTGTILLLQEYVLRTQGELPTVDLIEKWLIQGSSYLVDGDDEDDNVENTGLSYPSLDVINVIEAIDHLPPTKPHILNEPKDQTILEGKRATLAFTVSGTQPLQFQWQQDDHDIPNAIHPNYTTPPLTGADDNVHFRCRISNALGETTSREILLKILEGPIQLFPGIPEHKTTNVKNIWQHFYVLIPDDAQELTIKLSKMNHDLDLYVYRDALSTLFQWDFRSCASGDEQVIINHDTKPPLSKGAWFCSVYSGYSFASSPFTIEASLRTSQTIAPPKIISEPYATPSPNYTHSNSKFQIIVEDPNPLFYCWSFGDGCRSFAPAPSHVYDLAGHHNVTITVSNGFTATRSSFTHIVLWNPNSPPKSLQIFRMKILLNTKKDDRCQLTGRLKLPSDFNPDGVEVQIIVGNYHAIFVLDTKGQVNDNETRFKLKNGRFALLMNGNWKTLRDGSNIRQNVLVSVIFIINKEIHFAEKWIKI